MWLVESLMGQKIGLQVKFEELGRVEYGILGEPSTTYDLEKREKGTET